MVSRKLLALGLLLILGGVLLTGCICCCRTPDTGYYAPPAVPRIKITTTPVVIVQPVVVHNISVAPSPTSVATVRPNAT